VIHLLASVRVYLCTSPRLEEGTYAMPFGEEDEAGREITAQELGALLSGIDLSTAKRRKCYRRGSVEAV
jgi:hypothetical protein